MNKVDDVPYKCSEVEKTILGLCIIHPDSVHMLSEDLFYWSKNKRIFAMMEEVYKKHGTIELSLVTSRLLEDDVTTASYIASLMDGVSKTEIKNLSKMVDELKRQKSKREISVLSHKIRKSLDEDDDDEVDRLIVQLAEVKSEGKKAETLSAKDLVKEYEAYKDRGGGVHIGIPTFDGVSEGIAEGEVAYLLARAKVIKSVFVQNVLRHFSKTYPQDGAIFFSLEMSPAQLGERVLMIESGKPIKDVGEEDKQEMIERHRNIFYITTPALSLTDIYGIIMKHKFKANIRFVAIDFLTRIRTDQQGEYEFLRNATKFLKDMAKELNVALFVISQVGREVGIDGSKPLSLQAGRGSGTIEEDADFIFGAYRPELDPFASPQKIERYTNKVVLQTLGARRIPKIPDIILEFDKKSLRVREESI